jgi:leader peptidase (prepilin peptidase)/N-methyltransferase
MGSFLNVAAYRLPLGETLSGRSHCPHCHRQLGVLDLVPVFSFIVLGGRCRICKKPIAVRYILVELLLASLFAFGAYLSPVVDVLSLLHFISWTVLVSIGFLTFWIDVRHYLILDVVTYVGTVLALLVALLIDLFSGAPAFGHFSTTLHAVVGAFLGAMPFLLLWVVSRGRWIGFGDVKYMLFMGASLGIPLVFVGLLLSFWIGALVAIPLLLTKSKGLKSKLPLGTFLVLGQATAFLWGRLLLEWYMRLLGF